MSHDTPRPLFAWKRPSDIERWAGSASSQPRAVIHAVVAHLKTGSIVGSMKRTRVCPLCGADLGRAMRTDGTFLWPDRSDHAILVHQVWSPEHELVANKVVYAIPPLSPQEDTVQIETSSEEHPGALDDLFGEEKLEIEPEASKEDSGSAEAPLDALFEEASFSESHASAGQGPEGPPESVLFEELGYTVEEAPTRDLSAQRPIPSRRQPRRRSVPSPPRQDEPMNHYGMLGSDALEIAKAYPKAGARLANKIVSVANHIGADPYDLANLIHFESAGTFSPSVKNPHSGATGLIQFYPGYTKSRLGKTTSDLARLSALEQMDWVQLYFDKVRGGKKLDTTYKVAMAVFYPAALDWSPHTSFPDSVVASNPGIRTPHDYVSMMMRRAKLPAGTPPSEAAQEGALASLGSWFSNLFSPDPEAQPTAPISVQPQSAAPVQGGASWSVAPGLQARLVSSRTGEPHGPGPVPPGRYRLEQNAGSGWSPATSSVLLLEPGHRYELFVDNGALQWGIRG